MQYDMEPQQGEEYKSDHQMNSSPLVPVHTPEEQVHIPAVYLPSPISRNQYVLGQKTDSNNASITRLSFDFFMIISFQVS
jgi:hypothetical protein